MAVIMVILTVCHWTRCFSRWNLVLLGY